MLSSHFVPVQNKNNRVYAPSVVASEGGMLSSSHKQAHGERYPYIV